MNKTFLGLLLAVCVLGMALILLNNRMHVSDSPSTTQAAPEPVSDAPGQPSQENTALPQGTMQSGIPTTHESVALPPTTPETAAQPPLQEAVTPPLQAPLPNPGALQTDGPAAAKSAPAPTPQPAVVKPTPAAPKVHEPAPKATPTPLTHEPTPKVAPPTQEKPSKPQVAPKINKFVVYARATGATVRLVGNAKISYTNTMLQSPERLVIDLDGPWEIKAPGVPKNPLVTNIRIGKQGDKTRVVIDLSQKPAKTRYVLSKNLRMLDIRVDK